MGFQPGHKHSPGRPKGSSKRDPVKQIKDTVARKGFDLGLRLIEMIDDEKLEPALKLKAIQLLAQYTQGVYKDEPTEQDTTQDSTDRPTADLVSIVKS